MANFDPVKLKVIAPVIELFDKSLGLPALGNDEQNQKVRASLQSLDAVKQFVLNHRFGLNSCPIVSYEAIANVLTACLTEDLRQSILNNRASKNGPLVIDAKLAVQLETEALRELRKAKQAIKC